MRLPGAAQLQALKTFVPSLATYGAAAGSLVVFIASEWKGRDLLQYVPIYNRSVTTWSHGVEIEFIPQNFSTPMGIS